MTEEQKFEASHHLRETANPKTLDRCNYCIFFDYKSPKPEGYCRIQKKEVRRTQICDRFLYDWGQR